MRRVSTGIVILALVAFVLVAPLHARRAHKPGKAEIEKLVSNLFAEHIATRLEAQFKLVRIGDEAKPCLREAASREVCPYRKMILETEAAIDAPVEFFFDAGVRCYEHGRFVKLDEDYQRALNELRPDLYLLSYGKRVLRYAMRKIDRGKFLDEERYFFGRVYAELADATAERKLIGLLKRGDTSQRSIALELMCLRPTPRVIKILIEAIQQTEDSDLRIAVAGKLVRVRDDRVVEAFTGLIYDEEIGCHAILAVCADMGAKGKTNPAVTIELVKMLGDEDSTERSKACACLGLYKPMRPLDELGALARDYTLAVDIMKAATRSQTSSLLPYIRQFVSAPYPIMALTAVECLLQLGEHIRNPDFIPFARDILNKCAKMPLAYGARDFNYPIVRGAIDCLYKYFGSEAEDDLIEIVKNESPAAASWAAYGLRLMRSTKALPALREAMKKDFADDSIGIVLALIVLQDKEAIPLIEKHIDSVWPASRQWAKLGLFALGRDEFREEALAMAAGNQPDFRTWAMHAFALRGEIEGIEVVVKDIQRFRISPAGLAWLDRRLMSLTWHSVNMNAYAGTDVVRRAIKGWDEWLDDNRGKTIEEIRLKSFNDRGYKVVSFKTVSGLKELIYALNDTEADMRMIAATELAKLLGRAFPGQFATDAPEGFRALVVKQMQKWLAANADKLVWSAEKNRFITKKITRL